MVSDIDINQQGLDEFTLSTVLLENSILVIWLLLGTAVIWKLSTIVALSYLVFALVMLLVVLRTMICTRCYYYNRICHVGWGKLAALLFKQGDMAEFSGCTGMKIVPFFYMSLAVFPLILGVVALFGDFSIFTLFLMITMVPLVVLSSVTLRSKSCDLCKMKNICPGSAAEVIGNQ